MTGGVNTQKPRAVTLLQYYKYFSYKSCILRRKISVLLPKSVFLNKTKNHTNKNGTPRDDIETRF